MELNSYACYRAVAAHDARFDGVFFTCVSSTKIYCRPICPAQLPKEENCSFVATAAAAEKAGFRPCLRCRPECAPGRGTTVSSPARELAAYIDETLLLDTSLTASSARFNITDRHMRRLFLQEYGVEPKEYVKTKRLLFAKQLLQDTALPITSIAYASGFNTPGRFSMHMRSAYGLTPQAIRKKEPSYHPEQAFVIRAGYRPPFNWSALLRFLASRATSSERIEHDTYHRVVDGHTIAVRNGPGNYLKIEIPPALAGQSHAILIKVRRLFDLDANPWAIATALGTDTMLDTLIKQHPGLRIPGCWDNFEMLLRVIIGQQVSVTGATTIMRRLVDKIGVTPAQITASSPHEIAGLGMPLKRATTIWQVGNMVFGGHLILEERDNQRFYDQLVAIPGIGPWTAEYLQMRVQHWPDVLPAGDLGLQKAIIPGQRISERQLRERALDWQPWRSYATILLWKSLENHGG